jgi:hypothetical protein
MEWNWERKMSTKIGHFEILSELAKSPTCTVYKANDPEAGQTIALKAIQLSAFGEGAVALEQALLAEADASKILSSSNITNLFGAGEIEGQFCAAMEYVQGNSIATMLARKEGFSIWDLLDIGRQLCSGLDHAASHKLVHYSLEPSKIMCGWDGTVKILSFGVSSAGKFAQHSTTGIPSFLYYMSPEQISGQDTDSRSNLFSLGAMFYEMVTEQKAFEGDDFESLRQAILEGIPAPPVQVNPKVHPLLSQLIMKALAKDPAERYQGGRELLDDLEKCKEAKPAAAKKPEAAKGLIAPNKPNPGAQAKFATAATSKPKAPTPAPTAARPAMTEAKPAQKAAPADAVAKESKVVVEKAAAAAAGAGSEATVSSSDEIPELDLSNQFISSCVKATIDTETPSAQMSSTATEEPPVETFEPAVDDSAPKIAVDPMMAEGAANANTGTSFSDITELPPIKEVVAPPPPPSIVEAAAAVTPNMAALRGRPRKEDKPKVQTREVAEKAIKEIKNVPPKLMMYSISAAAVVILAIGIGVTYYVHSLNGDDDSQAGRPVAVNPAPAQPTATEATPQQPVPAQAAPEQPQASEPETSVAEPVASSKSRGGKKKSAPLAPAVVPGQLAVDSTPQGAQVQIDGQSDPSWVTPFALTNLQPGQHSITVSKAGYSTDTRNVNVTAGNRASTMIHLSQMMATLIVRSTPAGANIYVDGRDVGTKTPAQVSIDKGQHVVLVRMSGYLDETMNGQFVLGQTSNFSPTLRPLGNVDSIRTVGKMSKLFGGKAQAGQSTISIHTQPKGAQVAINQHLMEKNSPLDVAVDPGNYVVDITLTGYAPVHKIVTADQGGKVSVDEVLQPQ